MSREESATASETVLKSHTGGRAGTDIIFGVGGAAFAGSGGHGAGSVSARRTGPVILTFYSFFYLSL